MSMTFLDGHFPFCPTPATEWDGETFFAWYPSGSSTNYVPVFGHGTRHPIGFTVEELCILYWRVKHLTLAASATNYNKWRVETEDEDGPVPWSDGDVSPVNLSVATDEPVDFYFDAADVGSVGGLFLVNINDSGRFVENLSGVGVWREEDLVCGTYKQIIYVLDTVETINYVNFSVDFDLVLSDGSGLFYPRISALIQAESALQNNAFDDPSTIKYDLDHPRGEFIFELKINGMEDKTCPIYALDTDLPLVSSSSLSFVAYTDITFIVEAKKYWSYDGIYDEDTGEPV